MSADIIRSAVQADALNDARVLKHRASIQGLQQRVAQLLSRRAEIVAELPKHPLLAAEMKQIDFHVSEVRAQQKAEADKAAAYIPVL